MELVPLLSFLSLWVGCTSAQEIRPGPGVVNVPEGDDALLPCALSSGQSIDEFDWRKDNGNEPKKEVFMYNRGSYYGDDKKTKGQSQEFTNRVEFFQHELTSGNASIIIKNTDLKDSGTYTCGLGLFRHNRQEFHIRLNVDAVLTIRNVTGAARVPYIQTISDEITWRLLKCSVKGVPNPEVEWRNSAGKELAKHIPEIEDAHLPVELELNVTMSDNYTCVATQRGIYHQINNTLPVRIPETSNTLKIISAALGIVLFVAACAIVWFVAKFKCNKKKQNSKPNSERRLDENLDEKLVNNPEINIRH